MLEFLRKHQRYFFIVITVMIVISFSFFGTFNTLNTEYPHEQTVFTAVDGTAVKRLELDELSNFISTDRQDKLLLGGVWGPNFLNDGVIYKDFLESGMGLVLASHYSAELAKDLRARSEKEKRSSLYSHPQAGFINVESAWSYFAPQMKANYNLLQATTNPVEMEALQARISLFLQEKQFPAPLLRQVLRYQERQYSWLPSDDNLDYQDLSLFGYHTAEDWFGPRFVRLIAQFIINSAKIAEQKGYRVSKEEALAELMQHAAKSYQENINNPNLGVANLQQYFDEQLRRMGMDQNKAIKVWRDVLLFRRLFHDIGNALVVDPFSITKLQGYTKEGVVGQIFQLPESLRMDSYRKMQKLEIYLNAVSQRPEDTKHLLVLPTKFLTREAIAKKFPELLHKRYILEVAQVNKRDLQAKVSIKDTWNWEVEEHNWEILKKKFPELGIRKGSTREERFLALDDLDDKTRGLVDAFARAAIVDLHPEWIKQALEKAAAKKSEVSIGTKGGKVAFAVGEKRPELIQLLEQASLQGEAINSAAEKLTQYSPDNLTYYRIRVIDRASEHEIMTFAEAEEQDVLEPLLQKELEAYYVKIREKEPSQYKKTDGSWKPLADVQDLVADQYFAKIRKAIEADYREATAPQPAPPIFLGDYLASLRLYAYMREVRRSLEKDPSNAQNWIDTAQEGSEEKLAKRQPLENQWKLIQTAYRGLRSDLNSDLNAHEIFAMQVGAWSQVNTPGNGDINFFHLEKREASTSAVAGPKVHQLYNVLSAEGQRIYMQKLLQMLKEKKALSLDYMNKAKEE
ncbi:hypothetical protein [Neochlamydia sp. EPS4]|uniref:hypothetical protein n=1 Tax=Neochlamydia sp. EPS4 TaxID=1478175 RepID=UPI0005D11552|nr:hypothetical protein [Neochlamydia sp. EPS4]